MRLFAIETLRKSGFVRHDLNVCGCATYGVGRMRTFRSALGSVAVSRFVNSYRWAPVRIGLLRECGTTDRPGYGFAFDGSIRQPLANWTLRCGRRYVGGDTPQRVQQWLRWLNDRRWQKQDWPCGDDDTLNDYR